MALTVQTIVSNACQIAKCPGMTRQAGDYLNELLSTMSQEYDLPESQQLLQVPVGPNMGNGVSPSQPFQWYQLVLPAGALYLRTKEVFYNVQGTIFYPTMLLKETYDQLFQGSGISNYPYWYCPDQSTTPAQMAFYPPPNVVLTMNIRVQYQPPDYVNPVSNTSVPWFRNRRYLVTQLSADMMQLTGDTRQTQFRADATDQLTAYLKTIDDIHQAATTVKLDPLRFRSPNALPPTKQTGFTFVPALLAAGATILGMFC